jgi:hypothetical protein
MTPGGFLGHTSVTSRHLVWAIEAERCFCFRGAGAGAAGGLTGDVAAFFSLSTALPFVSLPGVSGPTLLQSSFG